MFGLSPFGGGDFCDMFIKIKRNGHDRRVGVRGEAGSEEEPSQAVHAPGPEEGVDGVVL